MYNYAPNTFQRKEEDYIRSQLELLDHFDEIAEAASLAKNIEEVEDVLNKSIRTMEGTGLKEEEDLESLETRNLSDSQKLDALLEQMIRLNLKINRQEKELQEIKGRGKIFKEEEPLAKGGFGEDEDTIVGTRSNPIDLTKLKKIAFREKKKSRGQHEKEELIDQLEAAEKDGLDESSEVVKKIKKRLQTIIFAEETDWKTHASLARLKEIGIPQSEINDVSNFKTAFGKPTRGNPQRGRGRYRGRNRYNNPRGKGRGRDSQSQE